MMTTAFASYQVDVASQASLVRRAAVLRSAAFANEALALAGAAAAHLMWDFLIQ